MSITEVLNMALPFAYVLVFIALVWFIVELVLTIRRARAVVSDVHKKLDPTLDHVEKITASLEPVAAKLDPLVERASLTVDAANLEIMRLDQILEDVNEITDTISSAANAVDTAANAPIELVSNVTSRVRNAFKPKRASSESIALGEKKISDSAQEAVQGVREAVSEQSALNQNRKIEREAASQARHAAAVSTHEAATQVSDAVKTTINADAADIQDRYFTYSESAHKAVEAPEVSSVQIKNNFNESVPANSTMPSAEVSSSWVDVVSNVSESAVPNAGDSSSDQSANA